MSNLNPLLTSMGYETARKQNVIAAICVGTALTAIVGVAIGVFALYGAVPSSTALWTQVGAFGGVGLAAGGAIMMSSTQKHKLAVVVGVITALALPVLFGSMGALGMIPPYNMLWAATMMCGGVIATAFLGSTFFVLKDCCCNGASVSTR